LLRALLNHWSHGEGTPGTSWVLQRLRSAAITGGPGIAASPTAPPFSVLPMDAAHVDDDLVHLLFTHAQIQARLGEMAEEIARDYDGKGLLLVGILRGAVMVMADLSRALPHHLEMDWIAISSYGSGTKSSGVVRLLKDLDTDITGRHVLIVDE